MFSTNSDVGNVNITGWDVSLVTSSFRAYAGSDTLQVTDVSQLALLHFSNNNFAQMFLSSSLSNINVTGWSIGYSNNTERFHAMFRYSGIYNFYGISTWNMSQVTILKEIFYDWYTANIPISVNFTLDVSGWDVSNVVDYYGAFSVFSSPTPLLYNRTLTINVSTWNTNAAKNMSYFAAAYGHFQFIGIEDWDVSNVLYFISMFARDATSNVNVSYWNVSNGISFRNMFGSGCPDVSRWNFSSTPPIDISGIFSALTIACLTLNTSAWETRGFIHMNDSFKNLPHVDVTHWDTQNLQILDGTFFYANPNITLWNMSAMIRVNNLFFTSSTPVSLIPNNNGISAGNLDTFNRKFCDETSVVNGSLQFFGYHYTNATARSCLISRGWNYLSLNTPPGGALITITPVISAVALSGPNTTVTINTTTLTPSQVVPYFYANVTITRGVMVHFADQMPGGTEVLYSSVSGGPVTFTNFTATTGDVVTFSLNAPHNKFQLWRRTTFIV
jgi:uncharacterized membrane protein